MDVVRFAVPEEIRLRWVCGEVSLVTAVERGR